MRKHRKIGLIPANLEKSVDQTEKSEKTDQPDYLKYFFDDPEDFPFGWQKTFDASIDIFVLISKDFEIIRINKAGYESLGKAPENLVGRKCFEVVHGLDSPIEGCPCQKSVETGTAGESEFVDHGLHFIATAAPLFDRNNELIAFAHTVKNITELKNMANELKAANKTLEKRVEERTARLTHVNRQLTEEVRKRAKSEEELRASEAKLLDRTKELEEKNIALRELIRQIEIEKNRVKEAIQANIREIIFPILARKNSNEGDPVYSELLKFHLGQISSNYGCAITHPNFKLTSRELEICSMVKAGLTSKEIANQLHISVHTVDKHRRNIRNKLDITNSDTNLASFLKHM